MTAPAWPDDLLLSADRVSKLYARRTETRRARLAQIAWPALLGFHAKEPGELREHEFWAVKDVSFALRRGEALGIIGLNGSGKTTLLRMLAGQILPDAGEIRIAGSSAAMIDLQAGFQPAASGRQNIFLRSAALGFSRKQALERLNEIIDFSELGDAIDAPMASYSSGMKMRLAFSVMTTVAPEVLFIDEVLGVGDFRFRQKCLGKIREMRERSSFVFVSHSMGDIARFCDRALVMHRGCCAFAGLPADAIAYYQKLERNSAAPAPGRKRLIPGEVSRPELLDDFEFEWIGSDGAPGGQVVEGGPFAAKVSFVLRFSPRNLVVGLPIYDLDGDVIVGFSTDVDGKKVDAAASDRVRVEFSVPNATLNPNRYRAAIGITDGSEFLHMVELPDLIVSAAGRKSWGFVSIPFSCSVAATSLTQPDEPGSVARESVKTEE